MLFRARQSVPRINGRKRCRHTECGRIENNFTLLQGLQISSTLEETFLEGCLKSPGTCHHVQNQTRKEKEDHARLPAQMPASRVSKGIPVATTDRSGRTQCQAEKDGNRGAGNTLARQQDRTDKDIISDLERKPQFVVEAT